MGSGFLDKHPHTIPAAVASVLLLGALGQWPYGYFTLLRWVTCIAAVIVAYNAYDWGHTWAVWVFGFVAILFNPLVPVYLSRDIWRPIDVATALLFTIAILAIARPSNRQGNPNGQ